MRNKNRSELISKARQLSNSNSKDVKRFILLLKTLLIPIWIISKITQWIFRLPMYICIGIGMVFESLDRLIDDLYHTVEDNIFLFLYKIMKVKEDN